MDILLTGNLLSISNDLLLKLTRYYRNILLENIDNPDLNGHNIVTYQDLSEEDQARVFKTYDFDTVIYFSQALDGSIRVFDELEKLERVIYFCRHTQLRRFIYLTTNDLQQPRGEQTNLREISSRSILMNACETLCEQAALAWIPDVLVLRVPYIYSTQGRHNYLYQLIEKARQTGQLLLRGPDYFETDFICDEDLGELLMRILDVPVQQGYRCFNLSGDNPLKLGELAAAIQRCLPDVSVKYRNLSNCIPICLKDAQLRQDYGWYPEHVLTTDLEGIVALTKARRNSFWQRWLKFRSQSGWRVQLLAVGETLLLFALAQYLNLLTQDNAIVSFLDFRLIFTVVIGTVWGLNYGLIAALLASLGYIWQKAGQTYWTVIFYNVQNWLPFACYLLLGAMSGYRRDRYDDDLNFMNQENQNFQEKYAFLNGLYVKVLENKENFSSQIIGYRNSFGKLYAVVKKLDSTLPDEIFLQAVSTLEDMLANQSVAIYIMGNRNYARLMVCSKQVAEDLNKSLYLPDYPEMTKPLKQGELYVNTKARPTYPAYAMPVLRDKELLGMILLQRVDSSQLSMAFANKFRIIASLIQDSLVRAIKFSTYEDQYLPQTQILCPAAFKRLLAVKRTLRNREYMDFILLRLQTAALSLEQISNTVGSLVRSNDSLGQDEEGKLYLLLNQTRREDLPIVGRRLQEHGIQYEVVDKQ
ncbi:MAG: hypothetical protein PHP39_08015 [Oscillospiraceae bacterium]|nr:hypothetical protein [Oscillospiraceae bacterium]